MNLKKIFIRGLFATFALFGLSVVHAINLQQFTRSNTLTFEMLEDARLKNSHVYNDYDFIATLGGSWVDSPLVIKNDLNDEQFDAVVPNMYGVHFGVGMWFKPWMQVGLTGTYSFFKTNHDESLNGFSDIDLKLKLRLLNETRFAVSVMPTFTIPLGAGKFTPADDDGRGGFSEGAFLSDESIGIGGRVIFEYLFDWAQVVANLGYRYSKDAVFERIDMDHQVYTGIGAYFPIYNTWGTNVEWVRLWSVPLGTDDINPNEIYWGVSAAMNENLHFFGGAGFGNPFDDTDGNDLRLSVGVKIMERFFSDKRESLELVKLDEPEPVLECDPNVFRESNTAVVRFTHDIFMMDDHKPSGALKDVLDQIADRSSDIELVEVQGHTSRVGAENYNQALGYNRAVTVSNLIIKHTGLTKTQVKPVSYGEDNPVREDVTREAERANRRVEFRVALRNPCPEDLEKPADEYL